MAITRGAFKAYVFSLFKDLCVEHASKKEVIVPAKVLRYVRRTYFQKNGPDMVALNGPLKLYNLECCKKVEKDVS